MLLLLPPLVQIGQVCRVLEAAGFFVSLYSGPAPTSIQSFGKRIAAIQGLLVLPLAIHLACALTGASAIPP